MIPSTGWLGPDAVLASELLPMALPVPVIGKYRDFSLLDPVPATSWPFPFTARIEGAHEVVTEAGMDASNRFSALVTLSLLEVFGAVLVDIVNLTNWLACAESPVSAWDGCAVPPATAWDENAPRPVTAWAEA